MNFVYKDVTTKVYIPVHPCITTLTECKYTVVSNPTEFKLRMLVVLDITCVIKYSLLGKTGFYDNKVIYL